MPRSIVNHRLVHDFLLLAQSQRCDLMGLWNSNGGFTGGGDLHRSGWAHGVVWAFRQLFGVNEYATGVVPAHHAPHGDYIGGWDEGGMTIQANADNGAQDKWSTSGGTPFQDSIISPLVTMPSDSQFQQWGGRYLLWKDTNNGSTYLDRQIYNFVNVSSPFAALNQKRTVVLTYGTHAVNGDPALNCGVLNFGTSTYLQDLAVGAQAVINPAINTQTGVESVQRTYIGYVNKRADRGVSAWPAVEYTSPNLPAGKRRIIYYFRFLNQDQAAGISYTHIATLGGLSLRDMAVCLGKPDNNPAGPTFRVGMPETQLAQLLREVAAQQPNPDAPQIMLITGDVMNGRNDGSLLADLSTGGAAISPVTDRYGATYDNCKGVRDMLRAAASAAFTDPSGVKLLLWGEHAYDGSDAAIDTIRAAMEQFAADHSADTAYVCPGLIVPASTMTANGWFDGAGASSVHLKGVGYRQVAAATFDTLLQAPVSSGRRSAAVMLDSGVIL